MKNSGFKGALAALAVVGVALAAKKMSNRRKLVKGIFKQYGITEKSPFAVADKIRELDDEKYAELKNQLKTQLDSKCCRKSKCCSSEA